MTFRLRPESSGIKQGKGQGKYYIQMEQYIWRPRSQTEHTYRDFSYVKPSFIAFICIIWWSQNTHRAFSSSYYTQ